MMPCNVTKDLIKIIFHPSNNESLIILNKTSIVYCEVKAMYDVSETDNEQTRDVKYQIETK